MTPNDEPSTGPQSHDPNIYRVIVYFGPGYDALFASSEAALVFAQAEMETLLIEYEDLGSEPFDGIFCERRDTLETWRFESVHGIPIWVSDPDIICESVGSTRGLNPMTAANLPRFYC
ncbi:MAG TPA: hypothetical protein VK629_19250 [Steroidobacteraceae bacterium]|nr:hypothetical protein [Steroidobacteraceae bacterium]